MKQHPQFKKHDTKSFPLKISSVNTSDLVTFTEENLNPNKAGIFENSFFWETGGWSL